MTDMGSYRFQNVVVIVYPLGILRFLNSKTQSNVTNALICKHECMYVWMYLSIYLSIYVFIYVLKVFMYCSRLSQRKIDIWNKLDTCSARWSIEVTQYTNELVEHASEREKAKYVGFRRAICHCVRTNCLLVENIKTNEKHQKEEVHRTSIRVKEFNN